jgi:predicted ATPase
MPAPSDDTDTGRLAGCAAVQLFVERAQAVTASFGLTAENQADVLSSAGASAASLALELAAVESTRTPAGSFTLEHRFQLLGVDQACGAAPDARHHRLVAAPRTNEQTVFPPVGLRRGLDDHHRAICGHG